MHKLKKILFVVLIMALAGCTRPLGDPTPDVGPLPGRVTESATLPPVIIPSAPSTPLQQVDAGDRAIFMGDYDAALQIFNAALSSTTDPLVLAKSNLGMGQAYYEKDNYAPALDFLRAAATTDDTVIAARAYYLLGRSFTALERYSEALTSYETYLQLQPGLIDSHIQELRGNLFLILEDDPQAIIAFQEAYRTHPLGGTEALAKQIAIAYQTNGDIETALALYQDLYNTSVSDYTKAEMALRIGQIYLAQGQPEQAYIFLQESVNNYPWAYDAYTALVLLVNDNIEVNEYQRGLINFNVGNYALAIEAFDRYLAMAPEANADSALYYKALAVRAAGVSTGEPRNEEAIALWKQLITTYPASDLAIDAWEDIEYTLWAYMDEPEQAAQMSLNFIAQQPEAPEAPNFLFLAGRSFERANQLELAAQTWQRIATEYPNSEETFRATYFAGIVLIRLGDWDAARLVFSRALVLTSQPAEIAAAHLWIGKCQEALGDISGALDSWKVAQTRDPFGYYSLRAEDLLLNRDVLTPPNSYSLETDLTPYLPEAEDWLRSTFALPPDTNLDSPGLLANDLRFQRGLEFWSLGQFEAGKAEFESMRQEFQTDPAQTFRLIPALVEIGLYRSALIASTNLLKNAGLEGAAALTAPEYFSRIRFGAYYLDWLLPLAEEKDFSPLLLLAIIRQESTFEGFIDSGAGARGLMQIIPTTGAQLANDLQWPENFTTDDLYRPHVSLVFGTTYLARQRQYFDGDLYAMLAAYNGGPGNTIVWQALAPDDPDLFLESIRIEETRNYIRLITEIHAVYRWLYGSMDNF